ncbi:unnamed protein product [Lota lota]
MPRSISESAELSNGALVVSEKSNMWGLSAGPHEEPTQLATLPWQHWRDKTAVRARWLAGSMNLGSLFSIHQGHDLCLDEAFLRQESGMAVASNQQASCRRRSASRGLV